MSIWTLLSESYSSAEERGAINELIAAINPPVLDVAAFQDLSRTSTQHLASKVETANKYNSSYNNYYSQQIISEAYDIKNNGGCITEEEKLDLLVSRFRGELQAGIRSLYESMQSAGTITDFNSLAELSVYTLMSSVLGLHCTHAYTRGQTEAFLKDVRDVLEENTFQFDFNAGLEEPPLLLKGGGEFMSLLSGPAVTASIFSGYSLQVVNMAFTPVLQVQNVISLSSSASFSSSFSLVKETASMPATVSLRTNLLDAVGEVVSYKDISITPGSALPVVIPMPPPPTPPGPPPPVSIADLGAAIPRVFNSSLISFLTGKSILTLEDISGNGGVKYLNYTGSGVNLDDPNVQEDISILNSYAGLNRLYTDDLKITKNLYTQFSDANPTALSVLPRSSFVSKANELSAPADSKAGYIGSAEAYLSNKTSERWVQHIGAGVLAEYAQFGPLSLTNYLSTDTINKIKTVFAEKCVCTDCEAATSPLAYLSELISYVVTYVKKDNLGINIAYLENTFCQPFGSVINNCSSIEDEVCYARVSIEILRRYYTQKSIAPTTALTAAIREYCNAAYRYILTRLGIDYRELTLMKDAPADKRKAYTESLGLYYDPAVLPANDILNRIWHVTDNPSIPVTEAFLEQAFGLQDTSRNAVSTGIKWDDTNSRLNRWNMEGVEYGKNTDAEGNIYLTMASGAVNIYMDAAKTKLVAKGTFSAADQNISIVEQNMSGLSGWVNIAATFSYTIRINVVPLYVCSQIRRTTAEWATDDNSLDTPVIDPDIMTLKDTRDPYNIDAAGFSAAKTWNTRKNALAAEKTAIINGRTAEPGVYTGPRELEIMKVIVQATGLSIVSYKEGNTQYFIGLYESSGASYYAKFQRDTGDRVEMKEAEGGSGNLYYNPRTNGLFHASRGGGSFIAKINPADLEREWVLNELVFPISSPNDVCQDDQGNIIVADSGNNRIVRFSPAARWRDGDGVQFTGNGYVVVETGLARVSKFGFGGDRIATFGYNMEKAQVGKWMFSGNLTDVYGHTATGYNLVYAAAASATGSALQLNGINAYFTVTSAADIDTGGSGYRERSIQFRFKTDNKDLTARKQVIYSQGSHVRGMNIYIHSGRIYAGIWKDNVWEEFIYSDAIRNNEWHHILVSVEGNAASDVSYANGFRLYIDGTLAAVSAGYKIEAASGSAIVAGASGRTRFHDGPVSQTGVIENYYDGVLDELWIWNRSFFDQEARLLYSGEYDPNAKLENPSKIWVDDTDNVYVLEAVAKKLTRFSAAGQVVFQISLASITPVDFVVDEQQNVIVLNGAVAGGLLKYNFSTNTLTPAGIALTSPRAIIRNVNKRYYVISNSGTQIKVLKEDLTDGAPAFPAITTFTSAYPSSWKSQNSPDGFSSLVSICADGAGNIIVADQGYNRIVKLSETGVHIETWGKNNASFPSSPNPLFQLTTLSTIAVDPNGNIYLKATSGSAGLFRLSMPVIWGNSAHIDPYYRIQNPYAVDVDANGHIYVADNSSAQLKVYNNYGKMDGVAQQFIPVASQYVLQLRLDRLDTIYIYDQDAAKISRINMKGQELAAWTGTIAGGQYDFSDIASLAIDNQYGNLLFSVYDPGEDCLVPVVLNNNHKLGKTIYDRLGITMIDFLGIENDRKKKIDIEDRLKAVDMDLPAFRQLIALINNPAGPDAAQLDQFTNILVNTYKRRRYPTWKSEEVAAGLSLSPSFFVNQEAYAADDFAITPWRSTQKERDNWLKKLKRRTDALTNLHNANRSVITDTEEQNIRLLRDALIMHSDATNRSLSEKARLLSAALFNDFEMNCCQKTTRLTQAIEAMQLLPWNIRNGQISDAYTGFSIDNDKFDEEWKWIGSYATWRAAIFVFVYPENLLDPSLRKMQSATFRETVALINENPRFSPKDAAGIAETYQDHVEDIAGLLLEEAVETNLVDEIWNGQQESTSLASRRVTFVFATGPKTKTIYYSIQGHDEGADKSQAVWQPVPGAAGIDKFVGAKQFSYATNRHLFVYFTIYEERVKKVMFATFDLDKGTWLGEPKEMGDLQDTPPTFDIVMIRHDDHYIKPGFFVNYHGAGKRYLVYCHMSIDGKGFDESAFYDIQTAENNDEASKLKGTIRCGIARTEGGKVRTFLVYGTTVSPSGFNERICEIDQKYSDKIWRFWAQVKKDVVVSAYSSPDAWVTGCFVNPATKGIVLTVNAYKAELSFQVTKEMVLESAVKNIVQNRKYVLPSREYERNEETSYRFVYQNNKVNDKVVFTGLMNIVKPSGQPYTFNLLPLSSRQIQPVIPQRLKVSLLRNPANLQTRRGDLRDAYEKYNKEIEDPVRVTIEEAFFHLPMVIADTLKKNKFFTESLDWYRMVYNYSELNNDARKIFYGLVLDAKLLPGFSRPDEWLSDPMNPHGLAKSRPRAYTKYTLTSIVNCMLDYADAEFTKDNVESIARARELYETVLQILANENLLQANDECVNYIETELHFTVTDEAWIPVWETIREDLYEIHDKPALKATITAINALAGTVKDKLKAARILVTKAIQEGRGIKTTTDVVNAYMALPFDINTILLGEPVIRQSSDAMMSAISASFYTNLEQATAVKQTELVATVNKDKFSWLSAFPALTPVTGNSDTVFVSAFADGMAVNASLSSVLEWNVTTPETLPASFQLYATSPEYYAFKTDRAPYVPSTVYQFCMPKNPVREVLVLRAELNLFKIRNCMNIAGMKRELSPFAAATDTTTGMPSIGENGNIVIPGLGAPLPTIYRYSVLIERAKQLTNIAQQAEAFYLGLLEKTDNESYQLLQAKQTVKIAEQTVKLQDLRVNESQENINLTDLQIDRAQAQLSYYTDLLANPLTGLELAVLGLKASMGQLYNDIQLMNTAVIAEEAIRLGAGGKYGNVSEKIVQNLQYSAQSLGVEADLLATMASNQRREQEWAFQKTLAQHDVAIAGQQKVIAQAQFKVVSQEKNIASIQQQHANNIMDFLQQKFTGRELYSYMSNIAGDVFSYFLKQATSMAKLAQTQLAFERQITPPSFILDDYYADVSSGPSLTVSSDAGYRGMTGSSRLLKDIYRLDEFAFEKDVRKLELSKTISVGSLYPEQLENLRVNGQMSFATPMELFDRDFPGHYCRLIKRVKVSTIALVPMVEGIKATLSNTGISRAIVASNNSIFTDAPVIKTPETIAFTGTQNATGILDLQPLNDKLLPFEGLGVDTSWQFTLPKFNNFFDFSTIADVMVTIEYTALEDPFYKQQVLKKLGTEVTFNRMFSLKNNFPDQWYDLSNMTGNTGSRQVNIDILQTDFPANITLENVDEIGLRFVTENNETVNAKVLLGYNSKMANKVTLLNGLMLSSASNATQWNGLVTGSPVGKWSIGLADHIPELADTEGGIYRRIEEYFSNDIIRDITLVITYSGTVAAHPDAVGIII
jgi:hypothetical protein